MAKYARHMQGNLLCAVDVETTGFTPGFHDVIQVAVLPLDADMRPITTITPVNWKLQQKHGNVDPKAFGVHGFNEADIRLNGIEPYQAADIFVEWFYKLGLGIDRRLIPLGHNYSFDRLFMIDWLGQETYDLCFHYHFRDSMIAMEYLNDRAGIQRNEYPFSKMSLTHLCSELGVVNERAHDALSDCVATAECYRRLCTKLVI